MYRKEHNKEHRDEIARTIRKLHIKKILILGTSEKMALKIATRLQLPQPQKFIHIEEIASQDEIQKAIKSRQIEGKHVIPVPAIEIKRKYPNIFYKPFLTKNSSNDSVEKSLVRPEFSKAGKVTMSEAALCQMVMHCVLEFDNNKNALVYDDENQ